jgi:hypothetical protein
VTVTAKAGLASARRTALITSSIPELDSLGMASCSIAACRSFETSDGSRVVR